MRDWRDLTPLRTGTPTQRAAAAALDACGALRHLDPFDALLAGTFPLGVDVESSDLDVLCYAPELASFADLVTRSFARVPAFTVSARDIRGRPVVIAQFESLGIPVEIFGQPVPVEQQHGFRHMLVEDRLLGLGGAELREKVRALKRAGMKTEPAFARILGLPGDPYDALLALENVPDAELRETLRLRPST